MTLRLIFLTLLISVVPAHAQGLQSAVRQFDDGNRLFREGDFSGAVDAYLQAVDAGYAGGALYYNLGNAYYRLDELGQAVRYYEKARRHMPESPELAHNLEIARQQTADSFSRLPEPFWQPIWRAVVELLSPGGLVFVGLLFYLAAAGAVGLRIRHGHSPWLRRVIAFGGALALCFLLLGFAASYERAHATQAVVLANEVTLLDRPNGSATDVRVHEGTIVDVVTTRSAWTEVRLPNGTRGWMQSDVYGTI